MKSGVSFFRALRMWSAYQRRGIASAADGQNLWVTEWLDIFFEVISFMPPFRVFMYLADGQTKRETVLTRLRDAIKQQSTVDSPAWNVPDDWAGIWVETEDTGTHVYAWRNIC